MKRLLLTGLIVGGGMTGWSQSLVLTNMAGDTINGQTIIKPGLTTDAVVVVDDIDVHNSAGSDDNL